MNDLYMLGEYEIDVRRRQLRRDGELVPLAQKPFEVLLALMGGAGEAVSKEELMRAIWGDAFVEESNLTQSVFLLRKALRDTASGSRYVITLPGVGYQLGVAPVAVDGPAGEKPAEVQGEAMRPVADVLPPADGRGMRGASVAGACVLGLLVILLAGWAVWRGLRPAASGSYTMRRLTNSGDIQVTAISLSGRYVAFVARNAQGREELSVLEVHSGNSHVIVDDAAVVFDDVAFSPDESYVYYRDHLKQSSDRVSSEYRIPLLGGGPTLVIRDIDGPVAFLDNGQQVCFWRGNVKGQYKFVSADADSGKNERTLAEGAGPVPIAGVCSPDGQRAAISSEVGGIAMLEFKTGERKPFYASEAGDEIYGDLTWKADGSGLMADAVTPFNLYPALIALSYPGGVRTQITHDLDSYRSPGVTGDGRLIVARQGDANTHFESFSLPLMAVNPEVISFPWSGFLGWRSDGEIVGSTTSGGLKVKDLATGQESSIQTAKGMQFLQPNGCGRSLLVASGGQAPDKGIAIWRMNADGSGVKQLSRGPEDILAVCTGDGRWVVYADNSSLGAPSIYKVSSDGGTPEKIGDGSVWFAVAHDGRRVAWMEGAGGSQSLVLAELETGRRVGSVAVPETVRTMRSLTFAPDDRSVYVMAHGETSDAIYSLPLDGSAATKQIEFRGAHLAALMVSPGGKYLGAVTAKPVADAVLLEQGR